jgi:hypothetical protein
MSEPVIPSFAVLGVVNEGKTSVVATLSEDPNVTPDPTPGATVECQAFPVKIDGREVLRLYDTPGFQNSVRTLAWFREKIRTLPAGSDLLKLFRDTHLNDPNFSHECELFRPIIEENAGILYVVDGSSPIGANYRAEMEILQWTGRPRMALINQKEEEDDYSDMWEIELGKFFNHTRRFNAHRVTYADRIELLRDLQHMDGRKSWKQGFETAIAAFEQRWTQRRTDAAMTLCRMAADCLGYVEKANYDHESELPAIKAKLERKYQESVSLIERRAHERLKDIYEHPVSLTELENLQVGLFHETTWQTLGLTRSQLMWAGAAMGAIAGGALDVLTAGHTLLLGAGVGALIGGSGAYFGGKSLGEVEFEFPGAPKMPQWLAPRGKLGGQQVQASCRNVDFIFVLLDRALLLYAALVNRAHARRDAIHLDESATGLAGITHTWTQARRSRCLQFAAAQREGWRRLPLGKTKEDIQQEFFEEIEAALEEIAAQGNSR